ncbi:MAG TPA: AtpZ/AtpI family protein [Blastocatellia bacterium]|nr:AtpZ/AtpI family protein [Blastocatellia bacterium]
MAGEPDNGKPDNGNGGWGQAMAAVGLALAIPWLIFIPAYIGRQLDLKYGTGHLWLIILLAFGIIATFVDIYRLTKRFKLMK